MIKVAKVTIVSPLSPLKCSVVNLVLQKLTCSVGLINPSLQVVNAAVIVDPSTRQVIASSRDQVLPCDALTNATSSESGCSKQPEATTHYDADKMEKNPILLTKCSSNEANQSYKNVSCLHSWGWLEQQSHLSYDSWHPLRHAAIVAIENSAARDRLLFPLNDQDAEFAQEDYMVPSPTSSPLKRQKVNTIVSSTFLVLYAFLTVHGGWLPKLESRTLGFDAINVSQISTVKNLEIIQTSATPPIL